MTTLSRDWCKQQVHFTCALSDCCPNGVVHKAVTQAFTWVPWHCAVVTTLLTNSLLLIPRQALAKLSTCKIIWKASTSAVNERPCYPWLASAHTAILVLVPLLPPSNQCARPPPPCWSAKPFTIRTQWFKLRPYQLKFASLLFKRVMLNTLAGSAKPTTTTPALHLSSLTTDRASGQRRTACRG